MPSSKFAIENQLVRALRTCDSFCTKDERKCFLAFAPSGKTEKLVATIEDLQNNPAFQGRGYRSKQYLGVWAWYQLEVFTHDQLRCQHCR